MSLSTYLLEYGRHVARLRRRRRRRRAYAPTSNTASHDNHKKILHGFPFLSRDDYGAPLGGPSGRRSSAITLKLLYVNLALFRPLTLIVLLSSGTISVNFYPLPVPQLLLPFATSLLSTCFNIYSITNMCNGQ